MKTILTTLCFAFITSSALAETPSLSTAVQRGLFEEEVNRDFSAAIRAYESAVADFDRERKLAATALFRLAENYRRAQRTGEAEALYERVFREFHDITELARLAAERLPEERLASLGHEGVGVAIDEEAEEIERLKGILERSPDQFYAHGGIGGNSFLEAMRRGHIRVMEFLVAEGFDVVSPWTWGDPPLRRAIHSHNWPAIEFLVNKGADVTYQFRGSGETLLHFAAEEGFLAAAELFLENGADVNARSLSGDTPLHHASREGFFQVAQLLLEHGADVNAVGGVGRMDDVTPLHRAVGNRNLRLVELLLEHGADVNARDGEGRTAADLLPDSPSDPLELKILELLAQR